jgi:hypothetical protein
VEEFGSVTRRFPWSVIAIEALSPQHLLGFLAPLFASHRRLLSITLAGEVNFAYGKS